MILLIDHDAAFLESVRGVLEKSLPAGSDVRTRLVQSEMEYTECAQFAAEHGELLQVIFLDIVFRENAGVEEWLSSAELVRELRYAVPHVPLVYMTGRINDLFLFIVCWGSAELVDAVMLKPYLLNEPLYSKLFPLDLKRYIAKVQEKRELFLGGIQESGPLGAEQTVEKVREEYFPSAAALERISSLGTKVFLGLAETHKRNGELTKHPYLTDLFTEGFSGSTLFELKSRDRSDIRILKVGPREQIEREHRGTTSARKRCPAAVVEVTSSLSRYGSCAAFLMSKHERELTLSNYLISTEHTAEVVIQLGRQIGAALRECWSDGDLPKYEFDRIWGAEGRLEMAGGFRSGVLSTIIEAERVVGRNRMTESRRGVARRSLAGLRSFLNGAISPDFLKPVEVHTVVAHGDLHFENILVDPETLTIRLLDFGQVWARGLLELEMANFVHSALFDEYGKRTWQYFSDAGARAAKRALLQELGQEICSTSGVYCQLVRGVLAGGAPETFRWSGCVFRWSVVWQLLRHARFSSLPFPRRLAALEAAWDLLGLGAAE